MTELEFQNKQRWLVEQLQQVSGSPEDQERQVAAIAEQVGLTSEELVA